MDRVKVYLQAIKDNNLEAIKPLRTDPIGNELVTPEIEQIMMKIYGYCLRTRPALKFREYCLREAKDRNLTEIVQYLNSNNVKVTIKAIMELYEFTDMKIADYLQKMREACKIEIIELTDVLGLIPIGRKWGLEDWNDFVRFLIKETHIADTLAFVKDRLKDLDTENITWLRNQIYLGVIKPKENVGFFEKYVEYLDNKLKSIESIVSNMKSAGSWGTYVIVGDYNMTIEGLKSFILTGKTDSA